MALEDVETVDQVTIKASRDYIIQAATLSRCDICKRFFRAAYDFVPQHKTHNFDNVVVCAACISHLEGFKFDRVELEKLQK